MLIRWIGLVIIGLSGGGFVAAGTFAFITLLGIVPRLAGRTATAKYILWYENLIILGGTIGNLCYVREWSFSGRNMLYGSVLLLCVMGVAAGMFVGCQAMALAEVLQVIPVFAKRIRLRTGEPARWQGAGKSPVKLPAMPIIVVAIALGKLVGSLVQLLGW